MPFARGLYYETEGQGPALLLLHGNGEDHSIFRELRAELKNEFTLYMPDSPGHGKSAPENDFSYRAMAAKIAVFCREQLPDKALVLGFSDGGIIALMLASLLPQKFRGFMLLGVNIFPEGLSPESLAEMRRDYELTGSPLTALMLREPSFDEAELRSLRQPVLLAAGEFDVILPAHTDYIASLLPDVRKVILPGEDHASYIWHSASFAPWVRRFAAAIAAD